MNFAPATAEIAATESTRLKALHDLLVLDSPAEPFFELLVQTSSQACGVPVSLLSLVDAERQWFKAQTGLPGATEFPRHLAFCAHAIGSDALFEVRDASTDPRFCNNALVTGHPHIRFYAGAPLVLAGGERVGTLCVIDRQPKQLTPAQALQLKQLAALATQALVLRRDLKRQAQHAHKPVQTAVADSEASYRSIVESQTELVSLSKPDGSLVFVNQACAAHFGFNATDMIGRSLYDYIDTADRDVARQRIAMVLATGNSARDENRMRSADGRERWVAWSSHLQTTADGQVLLLSVGRDVSDQRRAEAELRSNQRFLARIGRVAGVGGWDLDLQSQALRWSDETRRLHEVAQDYEPSVATAINFYAPEAQPIIAQAVQDCISTGQAWDLELPLVTASGRKIWVRAQGALESKDGRPRRLLGAFQDVTERRALQQRLAESERFVRMVTDSLPLRVNYVDAEQRFRFINAHHAQRFALPPEQILGKTRREVSGDDTDDVLQAPLQAALAGQAQRFEFEDLVAGEQRRIEVQFVPDIDEAGLVRGLVGTGVDVTERVAARLALQRQTTLLQTVTDALPVMVSVAGADGHLRFVNRAFADWAGQSSQALLGQNLAQLLGPTVHQQLLPWITRALAGEKVNMETPDAGPRGDQPTKRHLAIQFIPLLGADGTADGFLSVTQDVTQHKREARRLLAMSQRDPLTGLLNRRGASEQFEAVLKAAGAETLALLAIDLDHFKPVNDEHGHAVGDKVLQIIGERLQGLVRPSDLVVRMGGDEFALLLSGVRAALHAQTVADKVISAVASPVHVGDLLLQVGASVGLAWGVDAGLGADAAWADLQARADAKLYEAKEAGRGQQAI